MKGQTVNIDWVVGLSVFVVTVAGTTITLQENLDVTAGDTLGSKSETLSSEIRSSLVEDVRKTPLYVRQPHEVGKIPVDREYIFGDPVSVHMDAPFWYNETGNRTVAVVESGNESYTMTAFSSEIGHSYASNISAGDRISNDLIDLNPENGGLESIKFDGEEYLESGTDLGETGDSGESFGIYASAFDRLKVYTGSSEFIIENVDTVFEFRNFSKLYWAADSENVTLAGQKTFRDENTSGLVLSGLEGTDKAITAVGELDARVYRDSPGTVDLEVRSGRVRFMLHENQEKGRKRIESFNQGDIFFGVEDRKESATSGSIESLKNMDERDFRQSFELEGWGYNISGILERGSSIPLKPVSVESRSVRTSYWNGSDSFRELEVAVWQ
ncbi:MAG: hypothetical protein ABEJ03_01740 [Candidatus Nanohaloarchaea archaeon]